MNLIEKKPALLLIDVQKSFLNEEYWGGNKSNPHAEKICGQLLAHWRALNLPIFHIRHSSKEQGSLLNPDQEGFDFNDYVSPLHGETIITKHVNSAFIGTDLKEQLEESNINTLVIAGLTTNHCVSTTTRMAANYGFDNYLIKEGTASFDRTGINGEKYDSQTIQMVSLANLHGEFATVISYEDLVQIFNQNRKSGSIL